MYNSRLTVLFSWHFDLTITLSYGVFCCLGKMCLSNCHNFLDDLSFPFGNFKNIFLFIFCRFIVHICVDLFNLFSVCFLSTEVQVSPPGLQASSMEPWIWIHQKLCFQRLRPVSSSEKPVLACLQLAKLLQLLVFSSFLSPFFYSA